MIFFQSNNLIQTYKIANLVAQFLKGGDVITLHGNLGAGKTAFASGIIKALGVKKQVVSPTYNIIKEYKGFFDIYHLDMYRINSNDELYELGIDDCFYSNSLVIIEWNKLNNLRENLISIDINTIDFCTRQIKIKGLSNL
ncbi:MAG: tRNA (adenosine(37)-N6)-threonylcarbamoyltransferase complex ATPase subunit type 1 TsaE [Christensenellaceae bacterium]|jgi:tRNA threonylcarbamoyladenosine biosynthesis protein TsaE|nr:tRNA (adenosine(37)-N6)-threonylcarbamoyltransferase complex ATPase subunit type 1 TsaE [Christensenellaceae bacterium]